MAYPGFSDFSLTKNFEKENLDIFKKFLFFRKFLNFRNFAKFDFFFQFSKF